MQSVFEALASRTRRKILSKPSISQHLSILEAAGLVASEKRGQFVYYRQVPENLVNTLNGFVQEACPVSRPLKKESAALAKAAPASPET